MSMDDQKAREEMLNMYTDEDRQMVKLIVESKDTKVSRAQEIANFAKAAGYRKIGIAHCMGLAEEAGALERMLAKDFEVTSVGCKVFDLDLSEVVDGLQGRSCNPVGQAKVLADAGTEFNVVMGLCLGHDILFAKHSAAPFTTLVVKDRVHGHNPIAALRSE